ncbi:MAG: uroporphyrinogen decarboxylase family protein [Anaerolineae bacterium]
MRAYYRRENTVPLIGFFVGEYFPLRQHRAAAALPQGLFTATDVAIEPYLTDHERLAALQAACPGNIPYSATVFTGIPWMEAALGCPVVADHETGSCRSLPAVGAGAWPVIPPFSPDNPWVDLCLRMTRSLAAQAGGRTPLGTTLMRGVCDVLGALLGLERLVFEMVDHPERVHALAAQVAEYWIAFAQAQLEAMPLFQGGTGSLYGLWAPGRAVTLQEDNAALLSPRLYQEFIFPHDAAIAAAFDTSVFHLHPARYIPYRPLLDSPVSVVELHIDRGGPTARELLSVYREILAARPLMVWGDISEADMDVLLHEIGPEGVAIVPVVATVEGAWRMWERPEL